MKDLHTYKIKEITKIYDGDTITAVIDLGFNISVTERIRLYGIDTPEIRGIERENGLKAKAYLQEAIRFNWDEVDFYIKTIKDKKGKYGRYLGILYIGEMDMNKNLIEEGYAEPYGTYYKGN